MGSLSNQSRVNFWHFFFYWSNLIPANYQGKVIVQGQRSYLSNPWTNEPGIPGRAVIQKGMASRILWMVLWADWDTVISHCDPSLIIWTVLIFSFSCKYPQKKSLGSQNSSIVTSGWPHNQLSSLGLVPYSVSLFGILRQ